MRELTAEIYYPDQPLVTLGPAEIALLKERIRLNPRGRIRFCAHQDPGDPLHEMFILLARGSYIRPHHHGTRIESVHILEGLARLLFFTPDGRLAEQMPVGEAASGRTFYFRLPPHRVLHTFLIESEHLLFHETTTGPFRREDTTFAPWAPGEEDPAAGREFLARALADPTGSPAVRAR